MVCAPVRSIIPTLKLGDYLSVLRTNHVLSLHLHQSYHVELKISLVGSIKMIW